MLGWPLQGRERRERSSSGAQYPEVVLRVHHPGDENDRNPGGVWKRAEDRGRQELTFACGDERLRTRVVRVAKYASFEKMVDHEDPVAFGGEPGRDRDELPNVILAIHPPEKERLASGPSRSRS